VNSHAITGFRTLVLSLAISLGASVCAEDTVPSSGERTPIEEVFVDLDAHYPNYAQSTDPLYLSSEPWTWQYMPRGLMYRSYLAGTKESRFAAHVVNEKDLGWLFDPTLGARVPLLRFGTHDPIWPEGFEVQAEGSAQLRLDMHNDVDVVAVDFRAGMPVVYGCGPHRWKFAYYHLSSHVGDEFLIKNPGFARLNYSRDVLVLGYSYYVIPTLRFYGEAGWAFYTDISKPWEFQLGMDYAPACATGFRGAPFFAMNGQLREEVDFGGNFVLQTGWSWRNQEGALFRVGLHYYNGKSPQFSFFNEHEQQIGFGVWYDF
jgi:hypothetical protein